METTLYLAVCLAALWAAGKYWLGTAVTLASLATLIRPDGIAVLVAVISLFVITRRWSFRAALPGLMMVVGWTALALMWFGSPLPASGLAKMVHDPISAPRFSLLATSGLEQALPMLRWIPFDGLVPWIAALLCGIVYGAFLRVGRQALGKTILFWSALYIAGFYALGVASAPWYYTPLAMIAGLLFWTGAFHALTVVLRWRLRERTDVTAGAVLVLVTVITAGFFVAELPAYSAARAQALPLPQELAGKWLNLNAQSGESVVAYEIGMLAYFSGLRTIDLLGLTEPAARPFVSRGDYAWAVRDLPTYVFTPERLENWAFSAAIDREPVFKSRYRAVARFANLPGHDYVIYARDDALE